MSEMDAPGASGGEPAPAPPSSNWSAPPPAAAAAAVPGAAGFVYADVPNRVIALIIDAVILGIVNLVILGAILSTVGLGVVTATGVNVLALIVYAILGSIISLVYFVFTWTRMRASPGLKVLGMQVGNAADGATLTQDQAIKRWIALWGPGTLGQLLSNFPGIGPLLGLLGLGWMIYLLYTTYQSPTKQGFHDKYASTVVVKAATTVG
ncbi:MAG: RDD family protein [Chloroflexota bacterium]